MYKNDLNCNNDNKKIYFMTKILTETRKHNNNIYFNYITYMLLKINKYLSFLGVGTREQQF